MGRFATEIAAQTNAIAITWSVFMSISPAQSTMKACHAKRGVAHKSLYGQRKIEFPSGLRLGPRKAQNSDADHRRRTAPEISLVQLWDEGRCVMTWTSDSTGVLLYSVLATFLVLSWIYIPA